MSEPRASRANHPPGCSSFVWLIVVVIMVPLVAAIAVFILIMVGRAVVLPLIIMATVIIVLGRAIVVPLVINRANIIDTSDRWFVRISFAVPAPDTLADERARHAPDGRTDDGAIPAADITADCCPGRAANSSAY